MKALNPIFAFIIVCFFSCQNQTHQDSKKLNYLNIDDKIKLALAKGDFTDSCFLDFKFGMNQKQYDSTEKELVMQEKLIQSEKDKKDVYYYLDPSLVALLESYNVVENLGKGNYKLTEIGKEFNRLIIE